MNHQQINFFNRSCKKYNFIIKIKIQYSFASDTYFNLFLITIYKHFIIFNVEKNFVI